MAVAASSIPKARTTLRQQDARTAWVLLAPSLLVMLGITLWPVIWTLILSFFNAPTGINQTRTFVGLGNYVDMLTDQTFWETIWRTLYFTVVSVGLELALGLSIAQLIHSGRPRPRLLGNFVSRPKAALAAQLSSAPIIAVAIDLTEGSADIKYALRVTAERILATLPSARLACLNVRKQHRMRLDMTLDEEGHNKQIDRLIALRSWAESLENSLVMSSQYNHAKNAKSQIMIGTKT